MTTAKNEISAPGDFPFSAAEELQQSVVLRFERIVDLYPSRLAASDHREALTYSALNAASNRLAQVILENIGAGDQGPIAFLLGHEISALTALLAILKAGRPYIALHAADPVERLQAMISNAGPACVISSRQFQPVVEQLAAGADAGQILYVDDLDPGATADNPGIHVQPEAPFSIVYTSGSTGEPKGMVLSHAYVNFCNLHETTSWDLSASDRITLMTSLSFGAAFANVMGALLNGGTICLYDFRGLGAGPALEWIRAQQITVLRLTPSMLRAIFERAPEGLILPDLRIVTLGGEPAKASDVALFKAHTTEHCTLINILASTEASKLATFTIGHGDVIPDGLLPAGYPIPEKEIMLLDDDGQLVDTGEAGKIVIRSRYLASGYWRQPQLTAAKFRPDPDQAGVQIFYSGDLGRWRADGVLEFLGRKDSMVKIRGYRVELSEIEARLQEHPLVKEAAVIARPGKRRPDQLQLIAYVVLHPGSQAKVSTLRQHLSAHLPDYMVPSFFVFLDRLPLNVNGKVDRRALPDPSERAALSAAELPSDAIEERLVEIWSSILRLDRVGVHDNFFELGGDSLSVLSMMLDVEQALGMPVPQTFFRTPTIHSLGKLLQQPGELPSQPEAGFQLERPRVATASSTAIRSPVRKSISRILRVAKKLRWQVDEVMLVLLVLSRSVLGLTVQQARARVYRLADQRWLLNTLYRRKQRLFRRFLGSFGRSAQDFPQLFRQNVIANLLSALMEITPPFPPDSASTYYRDRNRLIEDTPLEQLDDHFPVSGLHHLEEAYRQGRGVVLVSFHGTAHDRVASRVLSRRLGGVPIQTIAHKIAEEQSEFSGYRDLMPSAVAGSLYAQLAFHGQTLLRQGKIVRLLSDTSAPGAPGRSYEFQIGDRRYRVKPGFAELALNTGAAVIPTFGRFIEDGRLLVEILPPLDPGRGTRAEQIKALVLQYSAFATAAITGHPEMMHWKKMRTHLGRRPATLAESQPGGWQESFGKSSIAQSEE